MLVSRAVESQLGPWSHLWGQALGGLGKALINILVTTPSSLPENEGKVPSRNKLFQNISQAFCVKATQKIVLGYRVILVTPGSHQVGAIFEVLEGTNNSKDQTDLM